MNVLEGLIIALAYNGMPLIVVLLWAKYVGEGTMWIPGMFASVAMLYAIEWWLERASDKQDGKKAVVCEQTRVSRSNRRLSRMEVGHTPAAGRGFAAVPRNRANKR
jgi:hypothetical protein